MFLGRDEPSEVKSQTAINGAAISAHPVNKMIDLPSIGGSLSVRVKSGTGRSWEALFFST
jgi:hypothetical protein